MTEKEQTLTEFMEATVATLNHLLADMRALNQKVMSIEERLMVLEKERRMNG